MTLLEYLRKTNEDGEVIQWLQRLHKKAVKEGCDKSLEEFAREYKCRGEKVIAAACVSRLRDRYYGQWMVLNVPFKSMDKLLTKEIVEKVPERYHLFACALHHAPDYWHDIDNLKTDMRVEAHSDDHIETVCSLITAQKYLVQRYLSGELEPDYVLEPDRDQDRPRDNNSNASDGPVVLDANQRRLKTDIDKMSSSQWQPTTQRPTRTWRSMSNWSTATESLWPSVHLEQERQRSSTDASRQTNDARILFAVTSKMRSRHPDIEV